MRRRDRQLEAALRYAALGMEVFPAAVRNGKKVALIRWGAGATKDLDRIRELWRCFPGALVAFATGERSGIVALDVDIRPGGSGFDTLEERFGVLFSPATPTAHTPTGGVHYLFRWPGHRVKTGAGEKSGLGPFLDIRGDGGMLILPPRPGGFWDPVHGLETPLAEMPVWMAPPEREPIRPDSAERPRVTVRLSTYAEAALDGAVQKIVAAPSGEQELTLNTEAYSIGRLAGGGVIPAGLALEAITWAARQMPSYDARRPWRPAELQKKARAAFTDGLARPKAP